MRAFGEGDLYPRWTDQTNLGLGAPSFILLTPLPYYGASAAVWLTGSPIAGLKLYFVVLSLAWRAAFYLLAADWLRPGLPAALSAGLYLLLPYHGLDRYQRFALSESTAFLFFPLILLFARRTVRGRGGGAIVGLAVSYAGLIYTHLVSALMFSLILGLWLLWETRAGWRALLRPALGLALGLGLAAPALLPAALEKGASNIAWTREMPNGDFRINFIFKDDLLPGLGFREIPSSRRCYGRPTHNWRWGYSPRGWPSSGTHDLPRAGGAISSGWRGAVSSPISCSSRSRRLSGGWCPSCRASSSPGASRPSWSCPRRCSSDLRCRPGGERGSPGREAQPDGRGGAGARSHRPGDLALCWQNTTLKPYRIDERTFQDPFVRNWIEPAFTPVQFRAYRTFKQSPRISRGHPSAPVPGTSWSTRGFPPRAG